MCRYQSFYWFLDFPFLPVSFSLFNRALEVARGLHIKLDAFEAGFVFLDLLFKVGGRSNMIR